MLSAAGHILQGVNTLQNDDNEERGNDDVNAGQMRQKTEDGYLLAEKALGMHFSPLSDQWPVCSSTHTLLLPHLKL